MIYTLYTPFTPDASPRRKIFPYDSASELIRFPAEKLKAMLVALGKMSQTQKSCQDNLSQQAHDKPCSKFVHDKLTRAEADAESGGVETSETPRFDAAAYIPALENSSSVYERDGDSGSGAYRYCRESKKVSAKLDCFPDISAANHKVKSMAKVLCFRCTFAMTKFENVFEIAADNHGLITSARQCTIARILPNALAFRRIQAYPRT